MAIIGIERLIYCIDDLELCEQFFLDFGLSLFGESTDEAVFRLPDNSSVILRSLAERPVPSSAVVGPGVHEIVWGVDTEEELARLVSHVASDRAVNVDEQGIHHFIAEGGLAMGLKHWGNRAEVKTAVDPVNSPGNINRMNVHRKWINRARPKRIAHVVHLNPEFEACRDFMVSRLGFRLTDYQHGYGYYLRCEGTNDHHNILMFNANAGLPNADGKLRFHHVNYTVTDLDEIMAGQNYMQRRGWPLSSGLGRHRIASALFLYFPSPTGGEAEYGADSDALDDNWVPRDWDTIFGIAQWTHDLPEFLMAGADWNVRYTGPGTERDSVDRNPVIDAKGFNRS